MRLTIILMALMILPTALLAVEGLKTNYYEAAVNSAPDPTINYKKWTITRNGKDILVREERDLARNGTWAQIDQIILFDGKKVVHFISLEGKRTVIYYPDTQLKVVQGNGDGDWKRITLMAGSERTVDIFQVDKSGLVIPVSDEELVTWQTMMKNFSEAMKEF